ncbi:helix-turn-helix domain-containing protein [Pseudomonas sp. NFIX28]|uniref:helix-turn-helix domain-containing protein n=1 Tax=Pseudomonas sp. NFIX28 TaxID=1566235 RepID=UPI00089D5D29|nr:helix-turn-helix domain-containing protein [Pseudomonas sp. NFIX28]SDZ30694.1 hypothetical protein SAMN03159453_03154 [Pseudomonas sp. NFIX28]
MTSIALNKVIHTAVSAPGAGKTQALISQIPSLLSAGRSIVLALPTLTLTDSFIDRLPMGTPYQVINSNTFDHVSSELNQTLREKPNELVITTHQSIFSAKPDLLSGWVFVVDELPVVADFPAYPFEPSELAQLFVNVEERDGRLHIREGCADAIETALATFKAVSAGAERTSMLSSEGARIYECLKDEHPVFIDTEMANGNRYVRAVVESTCWSAFAAAEEVHVLAATVEGSLFDDFAQVHGFTYERSDFTPEFEGYASPITIYPFMPKGRIYSKAAVTVTACESGTTGEQKQGELLVIDVILKAALQRATGVPLLFCNKWASFRWLSKGSVHHCSIDSRGLNEYQGETDAILLFGGNPSPSDERALEFLAVKYDRVFRQGFMVTRFLEPSLQAVTRTAIRDRGNTKPIQLFVQDGRVAEYVVSSYMPHAMIDWSLSEICPVVEDRRTTEDPRKRQVFELFAQDKKNTEIVSITGVHRNTVSNWRKDWRLYQAA